jgi:hypothetical protein
VSTWLARRSDRETSFSQRAITNGIAASTINRRKSFSKAKACTGPVFWKIDRAVACLLVVVH